MSSPPWLAKELEPKQNLFPNHLSSILHGALVGAGWFLYGFAMFLLESIDRTKKFQHPKLCSTCELPTVQNMCNRSYPFLSLLAYEAACCSTINYKNKSKERI
jgi:hypothetical protein